MKKTKRKLFRKRKLLRKLSNKDDINYISLLEEEINYRKGRIRTTVEIEPPPSKF